MDFLPFDETLDKPQRICVLGSTGSIGKSVLDIVNRHPNLYKVEALVANTNVVLLQKQIKCFKPNVVVMKDKKSAQQLRWNLAQESLKMEVFSGESAIEEVAFDNNSHVVISGIVGSAGLRPTLAAIKAGKKILLANKESLVMAGALFMDALQHSDAILLPIDSEHNAIFQCMPDNKLLSFNELGIDKLTLTASGGPFLNKPIKDLGEVTPEQACQHPTWSMGKKVSIDSATLMNKALELIEAFYLFNASIDQLNVVIHPQSIVHSMVCYKDGSTIAQMSSPDMRVPISHALAWPKRIDSGVKPLCFSSLGSLNFYELCENRFPALSLAKSCLKTGGSASVILNAANEEAVSAFLNKQLAFNQIYYLVEAVLNDMNVADISSLEEIFLVDQQARELAKHYVMKKY